MSHALATVLHRGRKAASNVMAACLASSRGSASPERRHGYGWVRVESTPWRIDGRRRVKKS